MKRLVYANTDKEPTGSRRVVKASTDKEPTGSRKPNPTKSIKASVHKVDAASGDKDEYTFSDMLDEIKDNFDYLIDGLTLLDQQGEMKSHEIAQDLMEAIQNGIVGVSEVNVGADNEENS